MFPELTAEEVDYTIAKVLEWDGRTQVSKKYRVVVVGMGKRGMHHALAFQANDRFEVAGVCDIDPTRLDAAAAKFGAAKGTDAREVMRDRSSPTSSASAPSPTFAPP